MNCIYKVSIEKTGGFYIGSTTSVIKRKSQHKIELMNNKHYCHQLQKDFNDCGLEEFRFDVLLDNIEPDKLRAVEYVYIDAEKDNKLCYNVIDSNGLPTVIKEKISVTLRSHYETNRSPMLGKKHSPETIAKIKANKHVPSGENHYRYGKTVSDETKKKIGDSQRGIAKGAGRRVSEEGMIKIREAAAKGHYSHQQGMALSEETREKMSKPIRELTEGKTFTSLTNALEYYDMLMPTMTRALKTGKAIIKGNKRGLQFIYISSEELTDDKNPNLRSERFVPVEVNYTACSIDGCNRTYAGNGYCMMHYKQSRKGTLKIS